MPLERANTIAQLDEQWPNGSDSVDRGDDHIRLIKNVLKKTFPGPTGNGFATPVTVAPALLNALAQTINDMKAAISNSHAIGNIIFRDDAVDPATLYPGTTWTLLTGDACIALATAQNVGQTSGNNNPIVPLPRHNHSHSMYPGGDHAHSGVYTARNFKSASGSGDVWGGTISTTTNASGSHTHNLEILSSGIDGATIDVRGTRKYLCAWKRVK